jgi:methyl-accepting chemotaxis protein
MQNRRQKFSLGSAFKLKLTRYTVVLVVFTLAILALCVLFFFLWSPIPRQMLIIADPYARSTARVFSNTVRSLFIFFFVINFIFLWLTSVIARRVIGPFVRLNRTLEELARGDIPNEIRFRKGDEAPFQELAEPLNRMLSLMRTNRDEVRKLKEKMDLELEKAEGAGLAKEVLEALKEVRDRLANIS